jgi:hypothetical protein
VLSSKTAGMVLAILIAGSCQRVCSSQQPRPNVTLTPEYLKPQFDTQYVARVIPTPSTQSLFDENMVRARIRRQEPGGCFDVVAQVGRTYWIANATASGIPIDSEWVTINCKPGQGKWHGHYVPARPGIAGCAQGGYDYPDRTLVLEIVTCGIGRDSIRAYHWQPIGSNVGGSLIPVPRVTPSDLTNSRGHQGVTNFARMRAAQP